MGRRTALVCKMGPLTAELPWSYVQGGPMTPLHRGLSGPFEPYEGSLSALD